METSLICKSCGQKVIIPEQAIGNVNTYNHDVVVISDCCGAAYNVRPIRKIGITPYTGLRTEDSWGNSFI